jgi:hypothetical protein
MTNYLIIYMKECGGLQKGTRKIDRFEREEEAVCRIYDAFDSRISVY